MSQNKFEVLKKMATDALGLQPDPVNDDRDDVHAAVMLLAGAVDVRARDAMALAAFTGYTLTEVSKVRWNIMRGELWTAEEIERWKSDETDLTFSLAVAVATGEAEILRAEGKEPSYRLTPTGTAAVEKLLKDGHR